MSLARLPLTVIGGYLGAGKTTLLNNMLRAADGLRIALIVNDFGAINIDATLIRSQDGQAISLTNGCVCCSAASGMATALHKILARGDDFDHIVIEASGVAEPGKIAQNAHGFQLPLDGVLVLADAEQIMAQAANRYVGDLVRHQLRQADFILLNKTDLVSDETLIDVKTFLALTAPGIRFVETVGAAAPLALLFSAARPDKPWLSDQRRPDHTSQFRSWLVEDDQPLSGTRFDALVKDLVARAIRAKGYLALEETPNTRHLYQQVGARWTLKPDGEWPEASRKMQIVAIALRESAQGPEF